MTRLVLALGQSQIVGAGPGGPAHEPHSGVRWYDRNQGTLVNADLQKPIQMYNGEDNFPRAAGNGNFPVYFCQRLFEKTGENVVLVASCVGGQHIGRWVPNNAGAGKDLFDALVLDIVGAAKIIHQRTGVWPTIDVALWHQGAPDDPSNPKYPTVGSTDYGLDLSRLISQVRSIGLANAHTLFIAGTLEKGYTSTNTTQMALNTSQDTYSGCVDIQEDGMTYAADNAHWDGDAQYLVSGLYFQKYLELMILRH